MSAIAFRRSAVLALTAQQRRVLRFVTEKLELGQPAQYTAPDAAVWYIFDDHRITLRDMAILGCFAATLASMPSDIETRAQLWEHVKNTIVLPSAIDFTGSMNPWQTVLDANSAPASVRAASGVPSTWTTVEA